MIEQPHEVIWTLTNAVIPSSCLHVVAELGVADHIADEPVGVKELASRCGADVDGLARVLRLLAAYGIFAEVEGAYGHTEPSRLLRSDHPMSMCAFASMFGLPAVWGSLTALEHSVRTGAPAVQTIEPAGFWAYLQARPGRRDSMSPRFLQGAVALSRARTAPSTGSAGWPPGARPRLGRRARCSRRDRVRRAFGGLHRAHRCWLQTAHNGSACRPGRTAISRAGYPVCSPDLALGPVKRQICW